MLNDACPGQFSKIYIRPGRTDCRKGIAGLSSVIQAQLNLSPYQRNVLFLFCGRSRKMMKALIWEGDGFIVMTKKLSNGKFQWPRTEEDVLSLTADQFQLLMQGFTIEGSIKSSSPKYVG